MNTYRESFEERLSDYPDVVASLERMVALIEQADMTVPSASAVEHQMLDELRRLGHEALQAWAQRSERAAEQQFRSATPTAIGHGHKSLYWYTTYGTIRVEDQCFHEAGHLQRPFSQTAEVTCRSYSQPLQRRITDFGADNAFGTITAKLEEHYGIGVPTSSARHITERHAAEIRSRETIWTDIPASAGVSVMIAETDGTLIPVRQERPECSGDADLTCREEALSELQEHDDTHDVTTSSPAQAETSSPAQAETSSPAQAETSSPDRRKTWKGKWREARTTLAHPLGSVSPVFGGAIGEPDEIGDRLLDCAIRAGMGAKTQVHAVGDGAPWIATQVARVFGTQGSFLVDFYHVCDYLAPACERFAPQNHPDVFSSFKRLLLNNQSDAVIEMLSPHAEEETVQDSQAPIRGCVRYLDNREGQLNYREARSRKLPIGSGEIESAHRYLIQKRLKLPGAWWDIDEAQHMIALRIARANGEWEDYWATMKGNSHF